ncbi:ALR1 [Candida margitis]|uniref:ALR1 n=1 Tax=Candida margitis TaxID=1775924 RepID=UPI002227FC08|nr:ALR1 [Candida margitis]KAI5965435.1 ALR1 [Candida margitis]
MIDDITDSFAPVIHGIEYEADAIEDAVFTARDTDFSNMLQRIGESRRKVMTLMRLLSGKADVIKMFAKRCQDEAALGYEKQQQQQQLRQQRYHQDYVSPRSSSPNIPETHSSGGGATPSNTNSGHGSIPPPTSNQPQAWSQNMADNARPRADIALYLGDIQDHIITMFQNLLAYEKIFSRSHSNYLAQLQVESFNSNNRITEMFSKVTIIGTMLVPLNLVTGLFGMNVKVPGQDSSIAWFFGIVGVLIVIVIASITFANWWLKSINRQIDKEKRAGFSSSRRSIRSLGLRRHTAKSIISFPNNQAHKAPDVKVKVAIVQKKPPSKTTFLVSYEKLVTYYNQACMEDDTIGFTLIESPLSELRSLVSHASDQVKILPTQIHPNIHQSTGERRLKEYNEDNGFHPVQSHIKVSKFMDAVTHTKKQAAGSHSNIVQHISKRFMKSKMEREEEIVDDYRDDFEQLISRDDYELVSDTSMVIK